MSKVKKNKMNIPQTPASALKPNEKEGFMTKCGGARKTWHKRFFILKDSHLYYFKKPTDKAPIGVIELESNSSVEEAKDKDKKRPFVFVVGNSVRQFHIQTDKDTELKEWIQAIDKNIQRVKSGSIQGGSAATASATGGADPSKPSEPQAIKPAENGEKTGSGSPPKTDAAGPATTNGSAEPKKGENDSSPRAEPATGETGASSTTTTAAETHTPATGTTPPTPAATPATNNSADASSSSSTSGSSGGTAKPAGEVKKEPTPKKTDGVDGDAQLDVSPRVQIKLAKSVIPFLQEEDSKVLEFWEIWFDSIAEAEQLPNDLAIEFAVSTSADMQKLTWRTAGPQNVFIQKMVDFFWNVGAPETEIDRLNEVGAQINPLQIGSWIDMSGQGGMDGGWYFPVDIPLKLALMAADPGEPAKKVAEWAERHGVERCYSIGRDMGAAPPRQTEMRLRMPGPDFNSQLRVALDAYESFGFSNSIPEAALAILKATGNEGLTMSVITSSEGFVRLGLLVPKPSMETVLKLCAIANGNNDGLAEFEGSLGGDGPSFVEYQYLKKGFGYGVYKEGFDIVFHYSVGEERGGGPPSQPAN